jgi:hypothetical protein
VWQIQKWFAAAWLQRLKISVGGCLAHWAGESRIAKLQILLQK